MKIRISELKAVIRRVLLESAGYVSELEAGWGPDLGSFPGIEEAEQIMSHASSGDKSARKDYQVLVEMLEAQGEDCSLMTQYLVDSSRRHGDAEIEDIDPRDYLDMAFDELRSMYASLGFS